MTRLLLISNDEVGRMMSGPGIRYYNLARELAGEFDVTLLAPNRPDVEVPGADARQAPGDLEAEAERYELVVTQKLPFPAMRRLARSPTRVVYDLYTPAFSEGLGFLDDGAGEADVLFARRAALVQRFALATGDAFICASERQRDLWLGELLNLGRIDLDAYRQDRTLRRLIDVVPFGLPDEPPRRGPPALKGVHPAIGEHDHVLLWAGGIWNWLDPLTPIRAVAELARSRDDVRLVFLGSDHPTVPRMDMANRAVELARSLGVLDRSVVFLGGWVPYGDRSRYLLEADVGVSAHFDSLETHFSFRTRLLDHFWAGLPTVTTGGDVLGELVEERRLGRVVAEGDVPGWVDALQSLLGDAAERAAIQKRLEQVRSDFGWSRIAEQLARLLRAPASLAPSRRAALLTLEERRLRLRTSLALGGPQALLARQARKLLRR